mgnify:CR=1 FL=1
MDALGFDVADLGLTNDPPPLTATELAKALDGLDRYQPHRHIANPGNPNRCVDCGFDLEAA